jgi:biopolymer transport protein ExbB/TolQ
LPPPPLPVQTAGPSANPDNVTVPVLIWILVAAGVVTLLAVLLRHRSPNRRARAVRDLLDSADALEARLRTARAEIEAVAGEQGQDPVGEAMREMLRQRLWLRDHGREASLEQLAEVRSSIDAARSRIETQLAQIERARAPLA